MTKATIDGKLAYFDAKKREWLPLDAECYQTMYPGEPDLPHDDISNNKNSVQDVLSKALKIPNVSFFAGI